jgi:predicted ATP-dependent protease
MMILSACLYRILVVTPLHLNANIVFEQSYQRIDGDSATGESTAVYVCISWYYPGLAVTGALDQLAMYNVGGEYIKKIEVSL